MSDFLLAPVMQFFSNFVTSPSCEGAYTCDKILTTNGPFPSCCLSRFRSESWCSTIVREMSLICIRIRN